MERESRRPLLVLLGLGALVAVAWTVRNALGIEWSVESVRSTVNELGVWGPIVFVLLMGFRAFLLVPSQIMLVAGGLAFGTWEGALYGAAGLTISGSAAFGIARYTGREAVLSRVPPNMRWAFDAAGSRAGAGIVVVGTGYPVGPMTAFHAGAGLTSMSIPVFAVALAIGALIRALIYAWFGNAIVEGDWRVIAVGVVGLLVAAVPLAHPAGRAWLMRQVRGDAAEASPDEH